jgi:transposase-like protein
VELPRTLSEAIRYFSDPDNCHHYMVAKRWPTGEITCPTCGGGHLRFDRKRRVYHCNNKHPKRQFSVKVGTIFEDSPLGLDKWLPTVWMIANMKNGVSSHEIARSIGVTQKTAWFMLHRIRLAMKEADPAPFSGDVEADETYIGGKVQNMHLARAAKYLAKGRWAGKVAVMGLLERHGNDGNSVVRTRIIHGTKRSELFGIIKNEVALGSRVITDALPSYASMNHLYVHEFVDHMETYVNGNVHTNGIENSGRS